MSKRIGMILDHEFPPDERVEKEALSLIDAGYEVYLLCLMHKGKSLNEDYRGIKIRRFKLRKGIYRKLSAAYLVLPFYRQIWRRRIKEFIEENKIDILHIHDLPLCDLGIEFKNNKKLPLVCDQHEYWSSWIVNTAHYNTPAGRVIKFLSDWKSFERNVLSKSDLIVTIEKPLREAYINEVGLKPERIICVPNTPSGKVFNEGNIDPLITGKYKNNFMIFYAGTIDILRGINLIINSLPELRRKIPNLKFVLAGRLARGCDPVRDSGRKGVEDAVEFLGWVELNQLPSYIAASSVCVFTPPEISSEINRTIATKIYQYLVMCKPIIVSESKLMKEFVISNNIGYAVGSNNIGEFIDRIMEIYSDAQIKERIKSNALRIRDKYYWESTVGGLLEYYKEKLSH